MRPSEYQEAAIDFIANGSGHGVVDAKAGSGKTTLLIKAADAARGRVIMFAFNVSISTELKERLSGPIALGKVVVYTTHGYGFKHLRQLSKDAEVDNAKYKKIFDELYPDDVLKSMGFGADMLVGCRDNVLDLVDLSRQYLSHTDEEMKAVSDKYKLAVNATMIKMAGRVVGVGRSMLSTVDYVDMIYLPVFYSNDISFDKYAFVFVDEAQDLNLCQQELIDLACGKRSRKLFVGDPNQAIYGFAGADAGSFNSLSSKPNTRSLPLSRCYRCGSSIISLAQEIVPDIEAADGCIEGEICLDSKVDDIQYGDLVVCRNVLPMIKLSMRLISSGKKANVVGVDLKQSFVSTIRDSKSGNIQSLMRWMDSDLHELSTIIRAVGKDPDKDPKYAYRKEKYSAIRVLSASAQSISDLLSGIDVLFNDSASGIKLSTIHRAKGLEADRVFILDPSLMPSKLATLEWEKQQEENLRYVAITRAKSFLGFITKYGSEDSDAVGGNAMDRSERNLRSGEVLTMHLSILSKRTIDGKFGKVDLWEMSDKSGNFVKKFGSLGAHLSVGSSFTAEVEVKNLSEYKGKKEIVLSKVIKIK